MYILGINAYHGGASACLISDGQLIAAAEEERFTRVKYWAGFPTQSIRYCLSVAGIAPQDLDHVGISRDPSANLMKKVLFTFARRPNLEFVRDRLSNSMRVHDLKSIFSQRLEVELSSLQADFHNVEHHRAHMASAYFVSPFDEAAVLSVDGMGDFVSTMWGIGKGNCLEVDGSISFPHSLGIFYSAVTQWLGFPKYGDEGKVMGLAPFGDPVFLDKMRKVVRLQHDGTFELDVDYFAHHAEGVTMSWDESEPKLGALFSERFVQMFGEPRVPGSEITSRHQDVAASLQAMLEETELAMVRKLQRESGQRALCMAGGVALNSAFNGRVLPETDFTDIYIQPAAGDAGTALGVCYFIYHQVLSKPRTYVMNSAYTGPQFDNESIEILLKKHGLPYKAIDQHTLVEQAADILVRGDVLGWFQGRMEWGPRALGNRSILADPRSDVMKNILNSRIKHRETFRPFAPSILLEKVGEYFDQDYPDPFMVKVYNVRSEKRAEIPAVTHVDGSGRLQTVSHEDAPRYWALIDEFRRKTGVPVVLNTSFNENEPIVCNPQEAIECFLRTRMDALAIGDYLIEKGHYGRR